MGWLQIRIVLNRRLLVGALLAAVTAVMAPQQLQQGVNETVIKRPSDELYLVQQQIFPFLQAVPGRPGDGSRDRQVTYPL